MERTISEAVGRLSIERVLFGYAEAIDTGDIESVSELFAKGVIVMPDGKTLEGSDEVFEHYAGIIRFFDADGNEVDYARGECSPRTRHVTTNVTYRFNNAVNQAEVKSYFTVYQTLDGQNVIVAGGRYVDDFHLDLTGWHVRERRIFLDNPGDITRHLKTDFQ